jgi:hypothetical protein
VRDDAPIVDELSELGESERSGVMEVRDGNTIPGTRLHAGVKVNVME